MTTATLVQQLRDLNGRHPSTWPRRPRIAFLLAAVTLAWLCGWQLYLKPAVEMLENSRQETETLKTAYAAKYKQAVAFSPLLEQALRLTQAIGILETQLPAVDDMSMLLGEIGEAALRHQLQFESAKPGKPETKQDYVEQAIAIRLGGHYHDIGRFAADLAAMPHILILSNMHLTAHDKDGLVILDAIVLTYFRRADEEKKL